MDPRLVRELVGEVAQVGWICFALFSLLSHSLTPPDPLLLATLLLPSTLIASLLPLQLPHRFVFWASLFIPCPSFRRYLRSCS